MCMSSPSAPPPPPPPPEPPKAPKQTDANVRQAKTTQRGIAARAAGRQSTLLGGQINTPADNQPTKTLLGQ